MLHFIDPTIDFAFKLILGTSGNENLLIDFINRIIDPPSPIVSVAFINPINDKQHEKDKFSVVDIKAIDESGIKYQIEIQLTEPSFLADRMLYTWSSIYHTQAIKGKNFNMLKPVISIWLLTGTMIKDDDNFHHTFGVWDVKNNIQLSNNCSIHVLELDKWNKPERLQPEDYWLYFFKEAKHWKDLPDNLKSLSIMRQAMNTLESIADSEEAYLAYLAREDQLMIERTIKSQLKESAEQLKESTEQLKESAEQLKESTEQVKDFEEKLKASDEQLRVAQQQMQDNAAKSKAQLAQANAKEARLLELLKQAGIDPDAS